MCRNLCFVSALAACLVAGGCGKSKLPTVAASGTVTYQGQPVAGAMVVFVATAEGGKNAGGVTDDQGRFQVKTYMGGSDQSAGALPGDYKVTVVKTEAAAGPDPMNTNEASTATATESPALKSTVPAKYGSSDTSDLKATVNASGGNNYTFELTD